MNRWLFVLGVVAFAGCARFQPQPISPAATAAAFDARALTNTDLRAFLETNHLTGPWPRRSWDLDALTLAAFYYQPAFAEARAQWASVRAARITAGGRPNPSVGLAPAYDATTPPPWILGLTWDIPIETAGKRGKRIAQAEHLSAAARWSFVSAAWQTRSRVRAAWLNLYGARETESLLARQESAQSNVVRLLEGQLAAGGVSGFEVTQARVALNTARLARMDATGLRHQARAQLANAIGLPLRALEGVKFSFVGLNAFPGQPTEPGVRRQAVLDRADVRGALAEYAASQSALQLEIARQYPDLHLGPGYELDQTDNKWSLGVTLELPILNQNQGPIAEAKAKRVGAAAHFLTVQAQAIGEIERALAGYRTALQQAEAAAALWDDVRKQLNSVRSQTEAGEAEPATLAGAEVEFCAGAKNRLDSLIKARQALGQLEDAVQSPLVLPESVVRETQQDSSEVRPISQHEP